MYKKHDSFLVLKHKKNKKINSIIDRIIKTSKDISIVEKLSLKSQKIFVFHILYVLFMYMLCIIHVFLHVLI